MVSGCRIGEVIALQGQDISSDPPEVRIAATFSRADRGYAHKLKPATKTDSIRYLRSAQLVSIALASGPTVPGCFVFTSVRGKPVSYDYFRKQVWLPALSYAGLEYRKIHTLRHTALSMALEADLTPPQVASIAGHVNAQQVNSTYGHVINKPSVPELDL